MPLIEATGADELMVAAAVRDQKAGVRSYRSAGTRDASQHRRGSLSVV